jgi:hypothetical protein
VFLVYIFTGPWAYCTPLDNDTKDTGMDKGFARILVGDELLAC